MLAPTAHDRGVRRLALSRGFQISRGQVDAVLAESRRCMDQGVRPLDSELGWKPRLDNLDTIVTTALKWEQRLLQNPW